MVKKPPYEELERRVQDLEKEVVERRQLEETLKEKKEEYQAFFNLSPDPIVVVQDKVVKLANSSYTELFGVSQEDVDIGFSLYENLQEKDKDAVHRRYEERLSGKELQEVHHVEIWSKNGNKIPCEAYSSLIQYDGRPALLAIIRDLSKRKHAEEELKKHRDHLEELVTERTKELQKTNEKLRTEISEHKQTEEALRKSEEKFRLLAENATDVIWTLDMNLGLTYISPSIFQLRGYTVEEAMAQSLDEMLFPQSSAEAMAILNQNLQLIEAGDDKGWAPVTFEAEQYCKDGTTIITRTNAKFLKGSDVR
jgi:PAS domain S-box-containing protein